MTQHLQQLNSYTHFDNNAWFKQINNRDIKCYRLTTSQSNISWSCVHWFWLWSPTTDSLKSWIKNCQFEETKTLNISEAMMTSNIIRTPFTFQSMVSIKSRTLCKMYQVPPQKQPSYHFKADCISSNDRCKSNAGESHT